MTRVSKKVLTLILAFVLLLSAGGCLASNTTTGTTTAGTTTAGTTADGTTVEATSEATTIETTTASSIDTSKEVHIKLHIWGDAPVDKTPLQTLSDTMKEKINATFEIVSMGWESAAFELLFVSGEPLDLVYVGAAGYPAMVRNGSLLALDDLLATYAPQSVKNIPQAAWDEAVVDGNKYAIPFRFTEYIPGGIVYRGDLLKKFGMTEIKSSSDMAAYFDKVLADGSTMTPFMPNVGWSGWYMGEMFINLTKSWIPLELVSGMMFAAESVEMPEKLFYPVFTDEFMEFATMMKDWDTKGYWSKDILSNTADPYNEFLAGKTAAYFQHAQGYIGTYGNMTEALPTSDPLYYCFSEANKKILKQPALANATGISSTSENPERALMALDLLLNDKEVNQLVQFGIQGKNYDLDADGFKTTPADYDETQDSYSVATWNLNVDEFMLPDRAQYPGKAELMSKLDGIAYKNPFSGFAFDNTNVANEVAAVNQVNSEIGTAILLGKVEDPVQAVESYRAQLTTAGIEAILQEAISQFNAFKAN